MQLDACINEEAALDHCREIFMFLSAFSKQSETIYVKYILDLSKLLPRHKNINSVKFTENSFVLVGYSSHYSGTNVHSRKRNTVGKMESFL